MGVLVEPYVVNLDAEVLHGDSKVVYGFQELVIYRIDLGEEEHHHKNTEEVNADDNNTYHFFVGWLLREGDCNCVVLAAEDADVSC